jgi:hypothetical protein
MRTMLGLRLDGMFGDCAFRGTDLSAGCRPLIASG